MADQALNGQRGISDFFATDKFSDYRKIRAVPRGIAVHWLAGNVPLLGMLALAQSILTKNVNILKAPLQKLRSSSSITRFDVKV